MQTTFQLLDADYTLIESKPVIRLFGRTDDNKSITIFYENFLPYFYVLPEKGKSDDVKKTLLEKHSNLIVNIEEVQKNLPIGYYDKPDTMFKVTLTNPTMVPTIRDELKHNSAVKSVFEADILFRYRFMTDLGIYGMRWYSVDGESTRTNTVSTEMKIQAKTLKEIVREENTQIRHMSIDIETLASEGGMPDSNKDAIILMSLCFFPAYKGKNSLVLVGKKTKKLDEDIISFQSEKEMLEEFIKINKEFDPDVVLGYNIVKFDLPYIEERLRKNNLPRTLGRCTQKPMRHDKFGQRERFTIPGRVVADVYYLVKEAIVKFGLFRGLKRYGLGDVSQLILGEGKIDIPHSDITNHWRDDGENFKKLIDYSRKDAELPMRLLFERHMLDKFFEISKVSGIVLQDVLDGGESARIENLLLREFNKRGFVLPDRPTDIDLERISAERIKEGLKGGFVLKPNIGFHDRCVVYLDFKAMYPSIMIAYNICPTTFIVNGEDVESLKTSYGTRFVSPKIRQGIIPQILDYLITTRDKIKKEMKAARNKEKQRYLYAKQYALKTVANAFYGYSGYIRARLYVLEIANTITHTGRETIMKTKQIIESNTQHKVIYADTDSVMVKLNTKDLEEALKTGNELVGTVNENLNNLLKIKIESIFKTLLILSKKRYAGWSFEPIDGGWDDSIVTKGIETVRRDWCNLVSETLEEVLNTILKEQDANKALKVVREKVDEIKTGKMDIDKLVITKNISKSIRSYKGIQPHVELVRKMRKRDPAAAPGVGDRISFVIVQGIGMISKRAEDPEYVKKHSLKIDAKYYVESQLLPPLERVFAALNINRSDLMGVGKQMGIFEAMRAGVKEQKMFEDYLTEIDGLICSDCNNIFRRVPLSGRCNFCNGELVFFHGEKRAKVYDPQPFEIAPKPS